MTSTPFSQLGISSGLLSAVESLGFEAATPIQAGTIPPLLAGKDLVGQSQTGSGKTVAFAIPAIEKVDPNAREVQVLILCPTRELALQVTKEVDKLTRFKSGIRSLAIYGGQSYERQFRGLESGSQIVVGTPGRVMDHMRRGSLKLDRLKMLVLDEADVMLDMGFRDDIEFVLEATPAERQTVFFSATMPRQIQELIKRFSNNPESITIANKALTVSTIEQVRYEVDRKFKMDLLTRLIDLHGVRLGIIFCNTKKMVDDLAEYLEARGYSADPLHGDMSQAMRDRVMNKFRKSGMEFLVATDVAARGIDVDDVEAVFNFDLPHDVDDYVHRIGRTGRAGRSGRAISFTTRRDAHMLRNIERHTRMPIEKLPTPTLRQVKEARSQRTIEELRAILKEGAFEKQDAAFEPLITDGFTPIDIASALLHRLQKEDQNRQNEAEAIHTSAYSRDEDRDSRRKPRFREDRPDRARGGRYESNDRSPRPQRNWNERANTPHPYSSRNEFPKPGKFRTKETTAKTRLFMNVGREAGVSPRDVVGAILGETGLPARTVGTIDLHDHHLFVDVFSEHANSIVSKLRRSTIRGRRVKIQIA